MSALVFDVEPLFGRTKNRVAFVGLELEGGWSKLPAGAKLVRDGSVFANGGPRGFPDTGAIGELPSDILEPAAVNRWLKKYYPDFHDDTCGLHVHMSFRSARHYEALMTRKFQNTILSELHKWGKQQGIPTSHYFWGRLAGQNTFCKDEFYPDNQALATGKNYSHNNPGSRYTVLNYCWGLHGTIECRVLPMFPTVELAQSAVRRVIDITNATLVRLNQKRERVAEEVILTSPNTPPEELDQEIL